MSVLSYWPCDPSIRVTSGFGWRNIGNGPEFHDGTDFGCFDGTPIYATHAGYARVLYDSSAGGYGPYVQIDGQVDGQAVMTQYGHLQKADISNGDVVPGQRIGTSGRGGGVAPHLHLRLHVDGRATDPLPVLADASWGSSVKPSESTFVPKTNEEKVIRWLLDSGRFSPAGVAGIAGNIQQESAFNPTATEAGRPFEQLDRFRAGATAAGYGLCQWSFDDEVINGKTAYGRLWGKAGLLEWCRKEGLDKALIDSQLRFMCWEIDNYWPGLGNSLASASDPILAAKDFGRIYEGWGIEGPRNDYAAEIHKRLLAGKYGPLTPTTKPSIALQYVAAILDSLVEGDPMSAIFIDIVGARPEGLPQTWVNLGLGFKPVGGTEMNRNQPAVANFNMSWGDFQPHWQQSMVNNEAGLDGQPDMRKRRVRDEAARQAVKAAGLDPNTVANTQWVK